MKGNAPGKLLCLLLSGMLTTEGMAVSAAEELPASQESPAQTESEESSDSRFSEPEAESSKIDSNSTELESESETSSSTESESESSSAAESKSEAETNSSTESETESSSEVDSETEIESSESEASELQTEMSSPTESETENNSFTESETEIESSTESEIESAELEPETELSELEMETLLEEEQTETTYDEYEEQSFIFINPLYKGIIDADKLAEQLSQQPMLFTAARESTSFSTFDEAASYLRGQMVDRSTTVSLQVPMSIVGSTENISNFAENLLTTATAHTEGCSGAEGDALAWTYGGSTTNFSYNSETCTLTFMISYYTTYEQEQKLTAKVNEALSSLNLSGKTDYEKVKAIHDYICNHVDYDYDNLKNDENTVKFSAYGALCEGKAVCQGYANAFYRMCKEVGLSARIITGTGNGGAHAWNIVKIGNSTRAAGEYYNIDCTWDGQDETTHHKYFLLNEADFADHTRSAEYNTSEFHSQYPMSASSYVDPGSFEADLNKDNPTVTFTTLDDTTVSSAANGKPKLIVFFKADCGNSQNTIRTIAGNSFPGVDIYAAESAPTTETGALGKDNVSNFKATYGNDQITFSYASRDTLGNIDNFLNLFEYGEAAGITNGNSLSVTYPVLCYIDANNKFQHITQGVQNASQIQANIEHYCGSAPVEQYTITYELNGGTNNNSNPSSYSAADTVVLANPTKAGCTFDGWYRDAAFTQKVTQIAKGTSGNITLYAKWTVIPATDKLNLDNPECELITIDGDYIYTTADGKPKLLIFFSVNCGKSQQTIRELAQQELPYVDIYAIDVIQSSKEAVTNFKNQYGAGKNFITYSYDHLMGNINALNEYANTAHHDDIAPPIICYIDANNKLQHITNGYNSVNTIKTNLETYCIASEIPPIITYTITYELNGGKNHDSNPGTYSSENGTITLQTPTREGYTFAGWYTDAEFTNQITQLTAENASNLTLYAKWESIPQPDVPPVDPTPGEDDNKPGEDDNKPSEDVNKPGEDDNKPGEDINKPNEDDNKPGEDVNKPGEDDNKPGEDDNKPGEDVNKPGEDDNKPGEDINKPGEDVNKPSEDDNKPNEDINKPGEDINKPIEDVNKPNEDDNNSSDDHPSNDNDNSENNNNNTGNSSNSNNSNNNSSNNSNSSNSNRSSNTAASASSNSNNNTAAPLNWNQIQANITNTMNQNSSNPAAETVSMDFVSTGEIKAPASILNQIKGKNAVIAFHNGQDVAMSINGMDLSNVDLSEIGDVNLTVVCDTNYIPETAFAAKAPQTLTMRQISVLNPAQLQIPVHMNVKVNAAYTGQYANLYRYNPQSGTLEYVHSCQIITGGYTVFPVIEGGNYLLTVTTQIPETDMITTQIPQETTNNLLDADEKSQYTIKPGDTLSAIAKGHEMSLADLLSMNPQLTDINKIKVNQIINVKQ